MKAIIERTIGYVTAALIICFGDASSQWHKVEVPGAVYCFANVPDGRGGLNLLVGTNNRGAYLSTDRGMSWVPVNTGMGSSNVYPFLVVSRPLQDTLVFAGTPRDGIFKSTDYGVTWGFAGDGITSRFILALADIPGASGARELLAGTDSGHVFRSATFGSRWTLCDSGIAPSPHAVQVLRPLPGGSILAGVGNNSSTIGAIFRSRDGGTSWMQVYAGYAIYDIKTIMNQQGDVYVFAAGSRGLLRSDTGSTLWSEVRSGFTFANAIAVSETTVFAGTDRGVFRSTDYGGTWIAVNDSLPASVQNIWNLEIHAGDLYAGSYNGIVYRRSISDLMTDVAAPSGGTPLAFALAQNYPNPFNPNTTIRYQLPQPSPVRLSVYDVLGREVSVLVNGRKEAGTHEAEFEAGGLSSGVYLYRLTVGDFTQTRRLLLVR